LYTKCGREKHCDAHRERFGTMTDVVCGYTDQSLASREVKKKRVVVVISTGTAFVRTKAMTTTNTSGNGASAHAHLKRGKGTSLPMWYMI